jgi:hypothetical protein
LVRDWLTTFGEVELQKIDDREAKLWKEGVVTQLED